MHGDLLPLDFYLRPVEEVAVGLLGEILSHGAVQLRITEVEAYGGPDDSASHARFGRTPRNGAMWEGGGRAYVYLCYGVHWMLNVVTGPEGAASAVLVRGAEILEGAEIVRSRRSGRIDCRGPGKVAQALALDGRFDRHPFHEKGDLELRQGSRPTGILQGPRVGIDYANPKDRTRPWRFLAQEGPQPPGFQEWQAQAALP
ncbi:MAG: DNA-3-methyladenine glycosylase [Firmicutes bacterium]|nr:DNA-3-methyladenine glycosylase [Bacillota bacterium]